MGLNRITGYPQNYQRMGGSTMSLHLKIKYLARQKGKSIGEVAESIGTTRQNYYHITRAEVISFKQLKKIAKCLNVNVCEIVSR
jgi:DNA-binding Xre family transcriptional regulator